VHYRNGRVEEFDILVDSTSTARLKTGAKSFEWSATSAARRVPPPLRFGAALVYVLPR
jgi:hypothetical protein